MHYLWSCLLIFESNSCEFEQKFSRFSGLVHLFTQELVESSASEARKLDFKLLFPRSRINLQASILPVYGYFLQTVYSSLCLDNIQHLRTYFVQWGKKTVLLKTAVLYTFVIRTKMQVLALVETQTHDFLCSGGFFLAVNYLALE